MNPQKSIIEGKTILGIELGSTRIKAILIDEHFRPVAAGSHDWENKYENGIWTYHLDDVLKGLQASYKNLTDNVSVNYGLPLTSIGAVGISAMMHGYLVFDKNEKQLAQFRTWRNTSTEKAAALLTEKFQFKIPLRWSIAHLYQAILNKEEHIKDIDFITTLAGFVHWKLTGNKTLGVNDASGMFPVDSKINNYNSKMLEQFDETAFSFGFRQKIANLLPKITQTGEAAGILSPEGALLLDPSGTLKPGIPLCPPEGDAGTGMVATNSITEKTGSISAGTSAFAMIVLEKPLSKVYSEIDIVLTPDGKTTALVHCNNCASDIDAWVRLFNEVIELAGIKTDKTALYNMLYNKALEANNDNDGLLAYNYYSGEHITGFEEGRPLFVRLPESNFTLANFMRTMLFSAFGTLKYGMNILTEKENVSLDSLLGHGGLFKVKGTAQRYMAAAFNTPVSVMEESAAEGGAWGIALLAAYMLQSKLHTPPVSLEQFLKQNVFKNVSITKIEPNPDDVNCFNKYMECYTAGLKIEQAAIENFK